jgi:putative transposase
VSENSGPRNSEKAIMKTVTGKRYTAEFRAQAVALVKLGKPVPEVAEDLSIGSSLLYAWMRKDDPQGSAGRGADEEPAADELRRLRREIANLKLENDLSAPFSPKTSFRRPVTDAPTSDKPSPNLLSGQPLPSSPGRVWAGDITFIPTAAGWLYLAVVLDLASRRIVGWSLADHLRSDLVVDALRQALHQPLLPGAIFHSDRGSQYGSLLFRQALAKAGLRQSMSARANPYENAWSESFIATLKREMLQGGCFENAEDARIEIFEYIEGYYNTRRKHSALAYQTPIQFEAQSRSSN